MLPLSNQNLAALDASSLSISVNKPGQFSHFTGSLFVFFSTLQYTCQKTATGNFLDILEFMLFKWILMNLVIMLFILDYM